jgi:hypothetical protein
MAYILMSFVAFRHFKILYNHYFMAPVYSELYFKSNNLYTAWCCSLT